MDITTNRTYYFTAAEMHAIFTVCQIADNIANSEHTDYGNEGYFVEDFFLQKYREYVNTGKCGSTFKVSPSV